MPDGVTTESPPISATTQISEAAKIVPNSEELHAEDHSAQDGGVAEPEATSHSQAPDGYSPEQAASDKEKFEETVNKIKQERDPQEASGHGPDTTYTPSLAAADKTNFEAAVDQKIQNKDQTDPSKLAVHTNSQPPLEQGKPHESFLNRLLKPFRSKVNPAQTASPIEHTASTESLPKPIITNVQPAPDTGHK